MTMLAISAPAVTSSRFHSIARSHVGRVRIINEDRVFAHDDACCWAVADGMGGHRGGDIAAEAVMDQLRALVSAHPRPSGSNLEEALTQANSAICRYNSDTGYRAGATVVAATADHSAFRVAWAGDSRAYRLRDGELTPLTHDHSVVQELQDAGLLTPEAAARHPQANVVTRALGVKHGPALEFAESDLIIGDRFLLCSDGFSRSLDNQLLRNDIALEPIADALMMRALERDGSDNISFLIIDCLP